MYICIINTYIHHRAFALCVSSCSLWLLASRLASSLEPSSLQPQPPVFCLKGTHPASACSRLLLPEPCCHQNFDLERNRLWRPI